VETSTTWLTYWNIIAAWVPEGPTPEVDSLLTYMIQGPFPVDARQDCYCMPRVAQFLYP